MIYESDYCRVSNKFITGSTKFGIPGKYNPDDNFLDNEHEKESDAGSLAADEDLSSHSNGEGSYASSIEETTGRGYSHGSMNLRTAGSSILGGCSVARCLDLDVLSTRGRRKKTITSNPLLIFTRPKNGYESLLEHARVTSGQNISDEEEERDDESKNPTPYERAKEKKENIGSSDIYSGIYERDPSTNARSLKFVPELNPAEIKDISAITASASAPGQNFISTNVTQCEKLVENGATNAEDDDTTSPSAKSVLGTAMASILKPKDLDSTSEGIGVESDRTLVAINKGRKLQESENITDVKFVPSNATEAKLHSDFLVCVRAIKHRKWDVCDELLSANPEIKSFSYTGHRNQTLLHIIANQRTSVPLNIVNKMLAKNNDGVGMADADENLPLHVAAINASNSSVLRLILNLFRAGAAITNKDGNLPLHLASACGSNSEDSVQLLLDAYPDAVHMQNNNGQIPLHFACIKRDASLQAFLAILEAHKRSRAEVLMLDNAGNSPLSNTIQNRVSYEFVKALYDSKSSFGRIFLQPDGRGQLPLYLALQLEGVDPRIVSTIIEAAPFTACLPTITGLMPIQLATKNGMSAEVIKSLLLTDMPIDFGIEEFVGFKNVALSQHSHSLWHVGVDCDDKYIGVVKDCLNLATQPQVIALARSFGPDGKTRFVQAASTDIVNAFRKKLTMLDRYELLSTKSPYVMNDMIAFSAIDTGGNSGILLQYNKSNLPVSRFVGNANVETVTSDVEEEKEVLLRCYYFRDTFLSEMTNRENYKIEPEFVENIHAAHECHNREKYAFSGGKLLAISFEKPDYTLSELYFQTKEKGKKWIQKKASDVLREIALCLEHLHNHGLVHGNVIISNVAKYGHDWKLRAIGGATPIGQPMSGPLRTCMPPEAIGKGIAFSFSYSDSDISEAVNSLQEMKNDLENSVVKEIMRKPEGLIRDTEMMEDLNKLVSTRNEKRRKRVGFMFFRMDEIGLGGKQGWHRHDDVEEKKAVKYIQTHASRVHEDTISKLMNEISRLRLIISQRNKSNKALTEKEKEIKRLQKIIQKHLQQRTDSNDDDDLNNDYKVIAHEILANPSWDVWSFGLIMAQLFLGRSVLLPNFEKDDFLLMKNLFMFDKDKLENIRQGVVKVAGYRAGDLLYRILHPDPDKRSISFKMILQHKYFREQDLNTAPSFGSIGSDNDTITGQSVHSRGSRSIRGILRSVGTSKSSSSHHKKFNRCNTSSSQRQFERNVHLSQRKLDHEFSSQKKNDSDGSCSQISSRRNSLARDDDSGNSSTFL